MFSWNKLGQEKAGHLDVLLVPCTSAATGCSLRVYIEVLIRKQICKAYSYIHFNDAVEWCLLYHTLSSL